MNQQGQIIVILLLVIVVALSIALSVIGRSINEISTSTKIEETSRAFSAAEAGLERILQRDSGSGLAGDTGEITVGAGTLSNNSQAIVTWSRDLPKPRTALEEVLPKKSSYVQFWLANPSDMAIPYYNQPTFEVYFGDKNADYTNGNNKPAIEVHIVSWVLIDGQYQYQNGRYFYDSFGGRGNGFNSCELNPPAIETNNSGSNNREFYCKATVPLSPTIGFPIMVRFRTLYSPYAQHVAIKPAVPAGCTNITCSFPPQLSIYKSVGTVGDVQRVLEVHRYKKVLPFFFDYALFSESELEKN